MQTIETEQTDRPIFKPSAEVKEAAALRIITKLNLGALGAVAGSSFKKRTPPLSRHAKQSTQNIESLNVLNRVTA